MEEKKTDEDDALLEEASSASAEWLNHDWTRKTAKLYRERYRVEMTKLYSLAQVSVDPRVSAKAGEIKELRVAMNLLTGMVTK